MSSDANAPRPLSHGELLELKRWNTPTIYNGWEQITRRNNAQDAFNVEETRDFMPHMGPMVGYAITLQVEPSNPDHPRNNPNAWAEYREYVASKPGPKVVVVQDLDRPRYVGAFWGEVNSNIHRALGCVGTITDGAIRDVDEMMNAGFKALAKRLAVGHANSVPVRWGCDVEVFGRTISPGQLIHADKHGFMVMTEEEATTELLEASRFLDTNECLNVIRSARENCGKSTREILDEFNAATDAFNAASRERFGNRAEW